MSVIRTAIGNLALPVAAFVTAPVLAQALGADGRGELAAAVSIVTLMTSVATFGIPEALTNYIARDPDPLIIRRRFIQGSMILICGGFVATVIAILISAAVAGGNKELYKVMVVCSFSIVPAVLIGAPRGIAAGLQWWNGVNNEKYVQSVLRLLVIAGAAWAGSLSVELAAVTVAYAPIIGAVAYYNVHKRPAAQKSGTAAPLTQPKGRDLVNYGSRMWAGSVSGVVVNRIDQVLMVPLASTTQLGLYAAAVNICDAALLVNNAVRDVSFARHSATFEMHKLTSAARKSFFVSIIICVALIAPIKYWYPLLFGPEFVEGIPAAIVLLIGAALGVPGSVGGAGLSALGRPGLRSLSLAITAVVNVVLVIILVPYHGAMGAALATFIANILASNLNLLFLRRYYSAKIRTFYLVTASDIKSVVGAIARLQPVRLGSRKVR